MIQNFDLKARLIIFPDGGHPSRLEEMNTRWISNATICKVVIIIPTLTTLSTIFNNYRLYWLDWIIPFGFLLTDKQIIPIACQLPANSI